MAVSKKHKRSSHKFLQWNYNIYKKYVNELYEEVLKKQTVKSIYQDFENFLLEISGSVTFYKLFPTNVLDIGFMSLKFDP